MPKPRTIVFIRHGESLANWKKIQAEKELKQQWCEANGGAAVPGPKAKEFTKEAKKKAAGIPDPVLSELGKKQAYSMRHSMKTILEEENLSLGIICASPLKRAVMTAFSIFPTGRYNQKRYILTQCQEVDRKAVQALRENYFRTTAQILNTVQQGLISFAKWVKSLNPLSTQSQEDTSAGDTKKWIKDTYGQELEEFRIVTSLKTHKTYLNSKVSKDAEAKMAKELKDVRAFNLAMDGMPDAETIAVVCHRNTMKALVGYRADNCDACIVDLNVEGTSTEFSCKGTLADTYTLRKAYDRHGRAVGVRDHQESPQEGMVVDVWEPEKNKEVPDENDSFDTRSSDSSIMPCNSDLVSSVSDTSDSSMSSDSEDTSEYDSDGDGW